MENNNVNGRFTNNFFWRLFERFGAQIVTLVVSIVLARLLDPTIYGTVALVTLFTTILQVFVDSGFGSALVQKKDPDNLDFSTIFWFNVLLSDFLYVVIFVLAPYISAWFNNSDLTVLIRVMSLIVVISGLKNIQQAYVSKYLLFKKFFFATLTGTIVAAVVGIWMAYTGYGVWALIAQHLVNQTIDTLILWITVKWRPQFKFSFSRFKKLFSFGWKILVSGLLETSYNEARQFIIGKKYSNEDLAFYNKGQQFPSLIAVNTNAAIDSVLLPVMSNHQENAETVKKITRKSIKTSFYVMVPIMIGLAVCAKSIVSVILTDKWFPVVFYMQVFCVSFMLYPIHCAHLNAIKALGRSDLFLTLEIIKKVVGIGLIIASMFISVEAMVLSFLISSVFSAIVNAWPNRKLLGYSLKEQLADLLPQLLLGLLMGTIVFVAGMIPFPRIIFKLIVQVFIGALVYMGLSYAFKIESFTFCLNMIENVFKKRKNR